MVHKAIWSLYNLCDNTGRGEYTFDWKRVTYKRCLRKRTKRGGGR